MTYLSYLILLMATVTLHQSIEETKTYTIKKIQGEELVITGKGESPQWEKASELSDFIYPWEKETPASTTFKALHSQDWLYCLFEVRDDAVNVYVVTNAKSEVINSDRVEIFFRKDNRLSPYYCLELDPLARVFDYEAQYHRKFNSDWHWPSGQLVVKSSRTKDGYKVEVAIHKKSLVTLGLLAGNKIEAGIFRAECVEINGREAKMKWISWVRPHSETPDFHIPSAFGVMMLED